MPGRVDGGEGAVADVGVSIEALAILGVRDQAVRRQEAADGRVVDARKD